MKALAMVLLAATATSGFAQATWQGLQYGMDRKQVQDALGIHGITFQGGASTNGVQNLSPDFELKTDSSYLSSQLKSDIAASSIFFSPSLSFDVAGKLQKIKLDLDQAKTIQSSAGLAQAKSVAPMLLAMIGGTSAYEQLTSKYGTPSDIRGACQDVPLADLVSSNAQCVTHWRDNGDAIELFWDYNSTLKSLSLHIYYSSQSTQSSSQL